jgi:hypothetical protein
LTPAPQTEGKAMARLKSLLTQITSGWPKAVKQELSGHKLASRFRNEFVAAINDVLLNQYPHLEIKTSVGGNDWARVPWLSIRDVEVSPTATSGFYLWYLFKADGSGVYLSLCQDINHLNDVLGNTAGTHRAEAFAQTLLASLPQLRDWGTTTIDLAADDKQSQCFQAGNIMAKYYPQEAIPSDKQLNNDLLALVDFYQQAKTFWLPVVAPVVQSKADKKAPSSLTSLSKPFILLAGLSGTGKTRFVRHQAKPNGPHTYQLVCVRPDWHEPSDLLGYLSRLGNDGTEYIVTDVLRFIVRAWLEVIEDVVVEADGQLTLKCRELSEIGPYWLCLDEMNLAPVEQYFADYLSVLETRKWYNPLELAEHNASFGTDLSYLYTCEPLLKADVFNQLNDEAGRGQAKLRTALGLDDSRHQQVWQYFVRHGVTIPFNLIVAGTVNMDETTHGFSRKVIDRALTFDFGEFFPNRFNEFFTPKSQPKQLDYPVISAVTEQDFDDIHADPMGRNSIGFLAVVNDVLRGSPFELAYRALNELLISVVCFKPDGEAALQAVWDDFLMCKILPRIDGDNDKLGLTIDESGKKHTLLDSLEDCLGRKLDLIWDDTRIELLLEKPFVPGQSQPAGAANKPLETACRSKAKLTWMKTRLDNSGFTSFWP